VSSIRLGVVGFGNRLSHVVNYNMKKVEPDLRVVGIVDPNEEGARGRLAEEDRADVVFYGGLDEMVSQGKLDALAIGTRCNLHTPYAIEAAKYDLPLFLEKPVATSMEQAVELERAFERSKCQVVVSFPLRVSPLCELAREYLEGGAVGAPEHVLAVNYVPYGHAYFDAFYRDFEVTQGLFIQKATHDFDYLMYLMSSPIVRVAAMASWGRVFGGDKPANLFCSSCDESVTCLESPRNRVRNLSSETRRDHPCVFGVDIGTPDTGMNEDSSSALIEFASGAKGVYTQVFYSRRDAATRGATVSGYHGTVSFDWYQNELKRVRHHAPFTDTVRVAEGLGHFGGDIQLAYNFIDLVQGKAKSKTPIETGIQSIYSCLAAKESAETLRYMEVRQVGAVAPA
jgi:predicted dehydrogenase